MPLLYMAETRFVGLPDEKEAGHCNPALPGSQISRAFSTWPLRRIGAVMWSHGGRLRRKGLERFAYHSPTQRGKPYQRAVDPGARGPGNWQNSGVRGMR